MLPGHKPARPIWYDGALVSWEDATASVLAHGIQRGSLVFDVGAMRAGADGGRRLFRPLEHIRRFLRSAALVGLDVRPDASSLLDATLKTSRASGVSSALVRWSAFVPSPEPDVVPRTDARVSVSIAVITADDYALWGDPPAPRPQSARILVPRDMRKAGPDVLPPQAKAAGAYLGPMLAKRRALAAGFDEVVLLDDEGFVAEAPTANVFAVIGGALWTPPLGRVLSGITRDSILAIARAEGIATVEAPFGVDELSGADEAFLTATSLPVQPIASVDGHALRGGAPGAVTDRLRSLLLACERGEDPRFETWTTLV
ncbi:MAG: aminotransferase class IV [Myxococcales bacterium]|nr:aminotransferase class IV [Myxococcales bacterium]